MMQGSNCIHHAKERKFRLFVVRKREKRLKIMSSKPIQESGGRHAIKILFCFISISRTIAEI